MSDQKKCPICKNEATEFASIDEVSRKNLSEMVGYQVPQSVCLNCFATFDKKLKGIVEKEARRATKEASRLNLWRKRVDIIRDARDRFAEKDFGGAVVSYEKYLRVVEMIYDLKPNKLEVKFFNNPARAKEMVLIATTYWDLVRIYDQSDRFSKRFGECAEKLVEFLPFTPIYSEVVHRLNEFRKNAKHKDVFNKMYRQIQKKKKRCFIATAAFESEQAPEVVILCRFRDDILMKSRAGRAFTDLYYTFSPSMAEILDRSPFLKNYTRVILRKLAKNLDRKYHLKSQAY